MRTKILLRPWKNWRKMPHQSSVSLITALLAGMACAQAQNAATISGVVVDPSDAVIIDAAVVLRSRTTHEARESKTDLTGSFKFAGVAYGAYDMEVRMPGFEPTKIRL